MGGQGFGNVFDIYIITFTICEMQPLNHVVIVEKFGPNELFTIMEKDCENFYPGYVTNQTNNNGDEFEAKVAIKLLNIVGTFQAMLIVPFTVI